MSASSRAAAYRAPRSASLALVFVLAFAFVVSPSAASAQLRDGLVSDDWNTARRTTRASPRAARTAARAVPTPPPPTVPLTPLPETFVARWREGRWQRAESMAAVIEGAAVGDRRARIAAAAVRHRVSADLVLSLDGAQLGRLDLEIERIGAQARAAHVIGITSACVLTTGLLVTLVGLAALVTREDWPTHGGLVLLGLGTVLLFVALVAQIDGPYRWNRWADSLSRLRF